MRPLRFSSPGNCTALQVQITVKSFLFEAVRGHDPGSTLATLSGRPDTRSTMTLILLPRDHQLLLSPQHSHTTPVPHFTLFADFLTVIGYSLLIDFFLEFKNEGWELKTSPSDIIHLTSGKNTELGQVGEKEKPLPRGLEVYKLDTQRDSNKTGQAAMRRQIAARDSYLFFWPSQSSPAAQAKARRRDLQGAEECWLSFSSKERKIQPRGPAPNCTSSPCKADR